MYACKRNSWIEFEPFNCLGFRALSFNQKQFFMFEKKNVFLEPFLKVRLFKKNAAFGLCAFSYYFDYYTKLFNLRE